MNGSQLGGSTRYLSVHSNLFPLYLNAEHRANANLRARDLEGFLGGVVVFVRLQDRESGIGQEIFDCLICEVLHQADDMISCLRACSGMFLGFRVCDR